MTILLGAQCPVDESSDDIWRKIGVDPSKTTSSVVEMQGKLIVGKENAVRVLQMLTCDRIAELCGNQKCVKLFVRIDGMAEQVMTLYNRGYIMVRRDEAKIGLSFLFTVPYTDEANAAMKIQTLCQQQRDSIQTWGVGDTTTIWKGPKVVYESWIAPELDAVIPKASNTLDYQYCLHPSRPEGLL